MYVDETPVQPKIDMRGAMSRDRGTGRPTKQKEAAAPYERNTRPVARFRRCAPQDSCTNLRISTFSISPIAMRNIIVDEPP